jgi:hypothetical protein
MPNASLGVRLLRRLQPADFLMTWVWLSFSFATLPFLPRPGCSLQPVRDWYCVLGSSYLLMSCANQMCHTPPCAACNAPLEIGHS